jgi:hypothetical protein
MKIRLIAATVLVAAFPCGVGAKGAVAPVYFISVPAAQPGNSCIAEGVATGQETTIADGSTVLVLGVHGADSRQCPGSRFPHLASTQKLAPEAIRNTPSVQCIPQGSKVGDEVVLPFYGRAKVLQLHGLNTQCNTAGTGGTQEATVIAAAAYRAQNTGSGDEAKAAETPSAQREPGEAEVRAEYDRLRAAAAPVEEYRVRHILVATRQDADAALARIKAGAAFAQVAAEVSADPGSRINGGDLGWATPSSFVDEFSRTMTGLKPAGLAGTPTQTRFGWHVIEVLE